MLQISKETINAKQSGFRINYGSNNKFILNILPLVVAYFSGVSGLMWLSELAKVSIYPFTVICILIIPLMCIKWKWIVVFAASIVLIVGSLTGGKNGLIYLVNQVIMQYNTISASEVSYYKLNGDSEGSLYFVEIAFISFYMAYMYLLISGKHWIHMLLATVLMDGSLIYLLRENSIVYLVFSTMALLGCLIYCRMVNDDTRILSGALTALSGVFIITGLVYINVAKETSFTGIYKIKQEIIHTLEEYRYGELDLPEGNLSKKPSESQEIRLKVTFEKPCLLYLRGYTAAEFEGSDWEKLDYDKYAGKREGMFQAYLKNDFHPFSQIDTYTHIMNKSLEEPFAITIENVNASTKYEWFPYGININDVKASKRAVKDECIRGNENDDTKSYIVRDYDYDKLLSEKTDELMMLQSDAANRYRNAEADYYSFVKENYGSDDAVQSESLAELCVELREELAGTGRKHDWNSMNYAAAGVDELRKHGYFARYVEGYYVDGRHINDNSTVEVRGKDAHAWAEVYKEKVGFIPVELTPGFYDNMEPEDETENIRQEQSVTQLEGLSNDKSEDREIKELSWRKYVIITIIVLSALVFLFAAIVIVRLIVSKKKRMVALSSDDQGVRLKMLSSYMLLLYRYSNKKEKDMPQEYAVLWNKFWFSKDNILEADEERRLYYYMEETREQLIDEAGLIKRYIIKFLV